MSEQNGIYITKKQASILSAVFLLIALLIFIVGYFWGKQSSIDGFTQKTTQESFNDKVDYVLTMQSFAAKHGSLPDQEQQDQEDDVEKILAGIPDALEESDKEKEAVVEVKPVLEQASKVVLQKKDDVVVSGQPHYAALAGFAKKSAALAMVQRMKKHNIDLIVKTRTSKSASGKLTKSWYQVVTASYDSIDHLNEVINKVVTLEHIKRKDIKII